MKLNRNGFLLCVMAAVAAVFVLSGNSHAQISVSITGEMPSMAPLPATLPVPTGSFSIKSSVTLGSHPLAQVVFYRNDVPYRTFDGTTLTPLITETSPGQDTYIYRARAYDTSGAWSDSNEIKLEVVTARVIKLYSTNNNQDHTTQIKAAIQNLTPQGGTLFLSCGDPTDTNQVTRVFNIKDTIVVPSNVTIQGETSEYGGINCQVVWNDVDMPPVSTNCIPVPKHLRDRAMFKIEGGNSHVRFKDLWLVSKSSRCWGRTDLDNLPSENNSAVLMDSQGENNYAISDVILENVSISQFTHGVKAIGKSVSDVKLRGIRTVHNYRQIFIDSTLAYNWDVQNMDTLILAKQGAVEIVRAGAPASEPDATRKLKFLQLSCAGDKSARTDFCVKVKKHGGLYFKQLHHEGIDHAITVYNYASTIGDDPDTGTENEIPIINNDPIIFEHGVATGEFRNASMKLYLIGNSVFAAPEYPELVFDQGRLRFYGDGINSTVVDCGDVHYDWTDTHYINPPPTPEVTDWNDMRMLFTHSERNRESFFALKDGLSYPKKHTVCPSGISGTPDINQIGGEYFNTAVMPPDPATMYLKIFNAATCGSCHPATRIQEMLDTGGTVYVEGTHHIDTPINIKTGRQLIGKPGAKLILDQAGKALLSMNVPASGQIRLSGIAIRNLILSTTQPGTSGILITGNPSGDAGVSSNIHFSDLEIEGFTKGLEVKAASTSGPDAMVDSIDLKNITFINNQTAAWLNSSNASNWNIMRLKIQSNINQAVGWEQAKFGNSIQTMSCEGGDENNLMADCLKFTAGGTYLLDFKKPVNVKNALTFDFFSNANVEHPGHLAPVFANSVIRDSNFTWKMSEPGVKQNIVRIINKAFITSMNNRYSYFDISTDPNYQGNWSRLTHCGDNYLDTAESNIYTGLAPTYPDLYVGVDMPTRIKCGFRPKPWEAVLNWGGEQKPLPSPSATPEYYINDKPLVGNFFDDVQEDIVIYREGPQSKFFIRKIGGHPVDGAKIVEWGTTGDIPLVGNFFPNSRAQIVAYRPIGGAWWVKNPNTMATAGWFFGGEQTVPEDIPFVGNFFNENNNLFNGLDEVGYYRPSTNTFHFLNPRTGQIYTPVSGIVGAGSQIQIGDFRGLGYEQVAQFNNGNWTIIDPRGTNSALTENLGSNGDVPVAGKYLSGSSCTQLGVWRPSAQKFIVKNTTVCGSQPPVEMNWGSNNNFLGTDYPDDIPLKINTADGLRDRPVAYRPTKGAFQYGIANGQWWIHDPF